MASLSAVPILPFSQVVATFPSAERCVEVIEQLHSSFGSEHKQRRLDIELYLSVRIFPEDPLESAFKRELDNNEGIYILRRAPKRGSSRSAAPTARKHDTFTLVMRYDNADKHQYQLNWVRAAVSGILATSKPVK